MNLYYISLTISTVLATAFGSLGVLYRRLTMKYRHLNQAQETLLILTYRDEPILQATLQQIYIMAKYGYNDLDHSDWLETIAGPNMQGHWSLIVVPPEGHK